jgi:hypothetical protein
MQEASFQHLHNKVVPHKSDDYVLLAGLSQSLFTLGRFQVHPCMSLRQ